MYANQVRIALSPARTSTYLLAQSAFPPCLDKALALYRWNVELSGALYWNLATSEVVVRNAVDDALSAVHGPDWPWSRAFNFSLNRKGKEALGLAISRSASHSTGKVMAELTLGFWEKMFRASFDGAIWNHHLHRVFPNLREPNVQTARAEIASHLDSIRMLRNRIAHHEPLLHMNVQIALNCSHQLVEMRCKETAAWLASTSTVSAVLAGKPKV